eukprot:TRINITY_DN48844_c0_g1_i1.p1 TRINITY_DN48844_c0_g1~~TRINITY_DN48844_c0_g1_i1.p1  ORF type:complete len:533 (+),score=60.61 TRINITY_DN48844_c0_g1_i1:42-1640(+)
MARAAVTPFDKEERDFLKAILLSSADDIDCGNLGETVSTREPTSNRSFHMDGSPHGHGTPEGRCASPWVHAWRQAVDGAGLSDGIVGTSSSLVRKKEATARMAKITTESSDASLMRDEKFGADVEGCDTVYWQCCFVVIPVFVSHAALFGLQHEIKTKLGIPDAMSTSSHDFSFAVSFLYIFSLIFRFSHQFLLPCLSPRARVFFSLLILICAQLVIVFPIMIMDCRHLFWVFIAYALGGVGLGCFESNFLAFISPFGQKTKRVVVSSIPVGIAVTLIGGFFVIGPPFFIQAKFIYMTIACGLVGGILVMFFWIPPTVPRASSSCNICSDSIASTSVIGSSSSRTGTLDLLDVVDSYGLQKFISDMRQFPAWLPTFWHMTVASVIDGFALACFSFIEVYIFDGETVALTISCVMASDSFLALFHFITALGSIIGSWLSYRVKPLHPMLFTEFSIVGAVLALWKIPILALVSGFFLGFGHGMIYGSIARHVDMSISSEFHLIAISFWLFVSDIGHVFGCNLTSYVRDWIGSYS